MIYTISKNEQTQKIGINIKSLIDPVLTAKINVQIGQVLDADKIKREITDSMAKVVREAEAKL